VERTTLQVSLRQRRLVPAVAVDGALLLQSTAAAAVAVAAVAAIAILYIFIGPICKNLPILARLVFIFFHFIFFSFAFVANRLRNRVRPQSVRVHTQPRIGQSPSLLCVFFFQQVCNFFFGGKKNKDKSDSSKTVPRSRVLPGRTTSLAVTSFFCFQQSKTIEPIKKRNTQRNEKCLCRVKIFFI